MRAGKGCTPEAAQELLAAARFHKLKEPEAAPWLESSRDVLKNRILALRYITRRVRDSRMRVGLTIESDSALLPPLALEGQTTAATSRGSSLRTVYPLDRAETPSVLGLVLFDTAASEVTFCQDTAFDESETSDLKLVSRLLSRGSGSPNLILRSDACGFALDM